MDFSTIKNQMEVKDGTGYKDVRQICADVRLVFKNAMKYNDDKSNVHIMAKTLLAKFEEKWLQLLPKVTEEVIYYSKPIWATMAKFCCENVRCSLLQFMFFIYLF